ncbi:MAG: protease inhibitor I9 family protein, partial [bacterium]|nr:protease inhibitor I9 family protein [Candidatus Kapabacteria bacterium]
MRIFRILPAFFAAALVVTGCDTSSNLTEPVQPVETTVSKTAPAAQVIPGRYIVIFRKDIKGEKAVKLRSNLMRSANVDRVYSHGVHGFAGQMTSQDVTRLSADPNVALIEPDRMITVAIKGRPRRVTSTEKTPWGITNVG